jgi:hypothetical protein
MRRQKMLALLDPIWLCLKYGCAPTLQGRKPFSAVGPQLLTIAYVLLGKKYRGIILSNIIPKSHISHWVLGMIYFFEVKYCQN